MKNRLAGPAKLVGFLWLITAAIFTAHRTGLPFPIWVVAVPFVVFNMFLSAGVLIGWLTEELRDREKQQKDR